MNAPNSPAPENAPNPWWVVAALLIVAVAVTLGVFFKVMIDLAAG